MILSLSSLRLSVLALAAAAIMPVAAHAQPLANLLHLHPQPTRQNDGRITFTLQNHGPQFQDIQVAGKAYTVPAHHSIDITAPVGTAVQADSNMMSHRRGELLLTVTPELKDRTMRLN